MAIPVSKPKVTPDSGLYHDAKVAGMPSLAFLAKQDPPNPELVKRCRDRYWQDWAGFSPDHPYSKMCPAMNAKVDEWATGRAALANQLYWYEQQKGAPIATVHDFYQTDANVTALFPAWLESTIQASLIADGLVPWLVMNVVSVDGTTAKMVYDSTASTQRELKKVLEGGELPRVTISLADSVITLNKFGRAIEATYESVALQKIDVLAHHIRRITQQVAVDETDQALHILIAGDGTTMGAAESNSTDVEVTTSGTITFADLIAWTLAFDQPYRCDKAVCGDTDMAQLLNLSEFKTNQYTAETSTFPDGAGPKNVVYRRWSGGVSGSSYVDRLIIGIDSRWALMKYEYGAYMQETDRIISRQVNEWTFSYYSGFRKFDSAATVPLDCAAVL